MKCQASIRTVRGGPVQEHYKTLWWEMIQYCIEVKLWGDCRRKKVSGWALCFWNLCYWCSSYKYFQKIFFLTTHLTMCICISRVLVQHLLLRQLPSRLLVLVIYSQHSFLHLAWTFFFIDEKVTSSKLGLGAVPGVWSPQICATPDSGKVHVGLVHTQIGGSQTGKLDSLGQLLDASLV